MKILAIDTSCDETAAAVTDGVVIKSNIVWSSISLHQEWGGVVPSIAKRAHLERIDEVIKKALTRARIEKPDLVAVTIGPGLAIALEIGIAKAKELARTWKTDVVAVNHIEGHVLSPLAERDTVSNFQKFRKLDLMHWPAWGLVVSGGHTSLILMESVGSYKTIATTQDDALGEALDKAARMLGLGYPGGEIIEKLAEKGNPSTYPLPLPMRGRENLKSFSYSGLKTAMWQLILKIKNTSGELSKTQIEDLAASFQARAFQHLVGVVRRTIMDYDVTAYELLVGGGVIANMRLRKDLRLMAREIGLKVMIPGNMRLCGDNAAMIGLAAGFKAERGGIQRERQFENVDRVPRAKIDSEC